MTVGNFQMTFELDLGRSGDLRSCPSRWSATRRANWTQQRNVIEVYFNDDDLDPDTAQDPRFYQLIYTGETVNNADDSGRLSDIGAVQRRHGHGGVDVQPAARATGGCRDLSFADWHGRGAAGASGGVPVAIDPGSSFSTAMDLTGRDLGANGLMLSTRDRVASCSRSIIPGGDDEPGHRDIPWMEDHLGNGEDSADARRGSRRTTTTSRTSTGSIPTGTCCTTRSRTLEKQRAREVFDLYANYLGVNFIESANRGFTIVTGDLRAVDPTVPTGVGGVAGIAGGGLAVMDLQDFHNPGDDQFGGPWFRVRHARDRPLAGTGAHVRPAAADDHGQARTFRRQLPAGRTGLPGRPRHRSRPVPVPARKQRH